VTVAMSSKLLTIGDSAMTHPDDATATGCVSLFRPRRGATAAAIYGEVAAGSGGCCASVAAFQLMRFWCTRVISEPSLTHEGFAAHVGRLAVDGDVVVAGGSPGRIDVGPYRMRVARLATELLEGNDTYAGSVADRNLALLARDPVSPRPFLQVGVAAGNVAWRAHGVGPDMG